MGRREPERIDRLVSGKKCDRVKVTSYIDLYDVHSISKRHIIRRLMAYWMCQICTGKKTSYFPFNEMINDQLGAWCRHLYVRHGIECRIGHCTYNNNTLKSNQTQFYCANQIWECKKEMVLVNLRTNYVNCILCKCAKCKTISSKRWALNNYHKSHKHNLNFVGRTAN